MLNIIKNIPPSKYIPTNPIIESHNLFRLSAEINLQLENNSQNANKGINEEIDTHKKNCVFFKCTIV